MNRERVHVNPEDLSRFTKMSAAVFSELRADVMRWCRWVNEHAEATVSYRRVSARAESEHDPPRNPVLARYLNDNRAYLFVVAAVERVQEAPIKDETDAWIVDALENAALRKTQQAFLDAYSAAEDCSLRLCLEPGANCPLDLSEPIIQVTESAVSLSAHLYMHPVKSTALIYEIGAPGSRAEPYSCDACHAPQCPYRQDDRVRLRIAGRTGTDVLELHRGTLLSDALRRYDPNIEFPCGGNSRCGKCAVRVTGNAQPASIRDTELLGEKTREGWRLACSYRLSEDTEISYRQPFRASILRDFTIGPLEPDRLSGEGRYFAAADIGTTTVCVYLVDKHGPRVVSSRVFMNPQRRFGADVVTRISYCDREKDGLRTLHTLIAESVREALDSLVSDAGIAARDLAVLGIVGNTVMQMIAADEPVSSIGQAPYRPAYTHERVFPAGSLGMPCDVYIMPVISGYIGGDIVAGILSCERSGGYSVLMDLGTNGEIALFNDREICTASSAAGPAFEGVSTECGMPAIEGAVTRVERDGDGFHLTFIGSEARGLCGSGLISLAALLRREGAIDETGRMIPEKIFINDRIFLSQRDVRQLQLAKGAVSAGLRALLHSKEVEFSQIGRVYLAGGFGNGLRQDDLFSIGMLDAALRDKLIMIGNSSAKGCIMTVLNEAKHREALDISDTAETLDLAADPYFAAAFVEEMTF